MDNYISWKGSVLIGSIKLDKFVLPSVFMIMLWSIVSCTIYRFYHDKTELIEETNGSEKVILEKTSRTRVLDKYFSTVKENLLHELVIIGLFASGTGARVISH